MLKARLNIVVGALLFSTGGVAIKTATLTGWQLSCFRSLVAGIAVLVLIPNARRGWSWRSLLVAVPYAATFTLFTLANKLTTAANAIFLQDTAPYYILLLGPLLDTFTATVPSNSPSAVHSIRGITRLTFKSGKGEL